jgi:hypothetical protein
MLQIVNLPTGNTIAEFAYRKNADGYLAAIETEPATHEITGTEEPAEEVAE